ncbi:MAG: DMT family transporter [Bacteroidota bacterium]
MKKSLGSVYVSLIMAMLFWGFTFVVFKFANESFRPISIIFFRLIVAIIFLFSFARIMRRLQPIRREDYKWLILLAFFEPFLYFLGESFGLTLVSSTLASVIISTIPLFIPVAAYFFYREKVTLLNMAGLLLSFMGVIMVVFNTGDSQGASLKGILLMLFAVLSAVGYTMTVKKLTGSYNPITITAWQSLIGMLLFLPLFLIIDLPQLQLREASAISIWSLVFLGVFGSSLAFILFTVGIREIGATKSNIFTNLIPVFVAILSFFLLDETMPLLKIAGIVLVLAGLFMTQGEALMKKSNGFRLWNNRRPPII